jgi:hypothetical protein
MNRKLASLLAAGGLFLLFHSPPVEAFSSFAIYGGAVHKDITEEALSPLGFREEPLKYLNQGLLEPDKFYRDKFTDPEHHFTEGDFQASRSYLREKHLSSVKCAGSAVDDYQQYRRTLVAFGEYLHATQDFYSHSNWVERAVTDGHQTVPLASFENLPSSDLVSPYFLYKKLPPKEVTSPESYEKRFGRPFYDEADLELLSDAERIRLAIAPDKGFTHKSLAKDNPKYPQASLRWEAGGPTLYELAYEVAIRDTRKQWTAFEQSLRAAYAERGANIVQVLKNGWASDLPDGDSSGLKVLLAEVRVDESMNLEAVCTLKPGAWNRGSANLAVAIFVDLVSDHVAGKPLYQALHLRKNRKEKSFELVFRTDLRGAVDTFITMRPADSENSRGDWEVSLLSPSGSGVAIEWAVEGPAGVEKLEVNRYRLSPPPAGWQLPEWIGSY